MKESANACEAKRQIHRQASFVSLTETSMSPVDCFGAPVSETRVIDHAAMNLRLLVDFWFGLCNFRCELRIKELLSSRGP